MKNLIYLAAIALCCASCSEEPRNEEAPIAAIELTEQEEAARLDSFIKRYETPPQVFTIPSNKASVVKGAKGSLWYVEPKDLQTKSGKEVTGEITVELKELTTVEELLKNNVQTVSNGKLLSSGGSYYIGMSAGGEELMLKQGKNLKIELPKLDKGDGMELFYGRRDEMHNMNWSETGVPFKVEEPVVAKEKDTAWMTIDRPVRRKLGAPAAGFNISANRAEVEADSIMSYVDGKPMSGEEKYKSERYEKVIKATKNIYSAVQLAELGWINVDKFLKSDMVPLYVSISSADSVRFTKVYVIFKPIRGIIQSQFFGHNYTFKNIPKKTEARIVAYGFNKNKIMFAKQDFMLENDSSRIELVMNEATEKDLDSFFD